MSILSVDEDPDFILDELQQCVRARKFIGHAEAMVIQSQCLAQLWDCLGPILVALHHSEAMRLCHALIHLLVWDAHMSSEVPLQVLLGHGSRDPLGSRDATAAGPPGLLITRPCISLQGWFRCACVLVCAS
eukprot:5392718-Amphidinium_carterae.1